MHETPCEDLKKCKMSTEERLDLIIERIDELSLRQASMEEIMLAWNNTKRFVRTIQAVSLVLRWIAVTGAAISVVWYAVTHMEWPK